MIRAAAILFGFLLTFVGFGIVREDNEPSPLGGEKGNKALRILMGLFFGFTGLGTLVVAFGDMFKALLTEVLDKGSTMTIDYALYASRFTFGRSG